MTPTLEQELEAVAAGTDYRLGISSYSGGLHVDVIYVPAFRAVDMGGRLPMVTNSGEIASKRFTGRRRWVRARKFVRRSIDGHRALLLETGVQQVR